MVRTNESLEEETWNFVQRCKSLRLFAIYSIYGVRNNDYANRHVGLETNKEAAFMPSPWHSVWCTEIYGPFVWWITLFCKPAISVGYDLWTKYCSWSYKFISRIFHQSIIFVHAISQRFSRWQIKIYWKYANRRCLTDV